jgi:lycopene beta-cyclase
VNSVLVLVGGGLANCLIARRAAEANPDPDIVVIERGPTLGGNHTWSFHDSDLTAGQRRWVEPLVAHRWPRHELRFPRRHRVMDGGYNSVTSERLHAVVSRELGDRVVLGAEVVEVRADGVTLADGRNIGARAVVDGRGDPGSRHLDVAYQKFVGLFVRLAAPHGLDGPILMDATVDQTDGYRFVYTLPFSGTELLIEDTYYADHPGLDDDSLGQEIIGYAAERGWKIAAITGSERGVLPITLGGDIEAFWDDGPAEVARSGMRGAFFHPTTGYSLPDAVRLADRVVALDDPDGPALYRMTRERSMRLWADTGYFRLLNRMLFRAADPHLRYRVFERFYGLSDGLIRRFYAGRLKWTDKVRVLIGKPPVPIRRALGCLPERPPASRSPAQPAGDQRD